MHEGKKVFNAWRWVSEKRGIGPAIMRLLLMAVACYVLLASVDPAVHHFSLGWRNLLPVFLVAAFLYGILGRWLFSIWITLLATGAFYALSRVKVQNMNMPLLPADIVLRKQVLDNIGFFEHYVAHGTVALVTLIVLVIVSWLVWRLERHAARLPAWARVVCLVVPAACLYTMFWGYGFWKNVYSNQTLDGFQLWDPAKSIQRSGLVAGFMRMGQAMKTPVPPANVGLVKKFVAEHQNQIDGRQHRLLPAQLPDIVVVQSEAFFDPGIMNQIMPGEFDPNFYRLSRMGIHGALKIPTYGGGTIRTEFETLTGYPMQAFPAVLYPYYGLVQNWMPSVPRRLAKLGYSTTLFHPFIGSFWDRRQVMPELGFQTLYFEKAFGKVKRAGLYIADHSLFKFVLEHLKYNNKRPQYAMVITMENHGPWDRDPGKLSALLDGYKLPAGLSVKGKQEMTYYLSHLMNGDRALGIFAKKLLARKRWTILVFYGDHLAALNAAFKDVGFKDGKSHSEQKGRYMVISNRPLDARRMDMPSYELPGLLFDTIGLPEDGYLAIDAEARKARVASGAPESRYRSLLFNAARMEVACRSKLNSDGACGKPLADSPGVNAKVVEGKAPSVRHLPPAPEREASCAGGSCKNGELQIKPAGVVECSGEATPSTIEVKWHVNNVKSGFIALWVRGPSKGSKATLWAEKPPNGHGETGPWVVPGMRIIMADGGSGKKLSVLEVPPLPCDRGQPRRRV